MLYVLPCSPRHRNPAARQRQNLAPAQWPAVSPRRSVGYLSGDGGAAERRESADDVVSEPPRPADTTEETVTRGRASGTPFVLLGGVALVIWSIVAIVAAVLLLVWWLA